MIYVYNECNVYYHGNTERNTIPYTKSDGNVIYCIHGYRKNSRIAKLKLQIKIRNGWE
jgi:hypothetical protein